MPFNTSTASVQERLEGLMFCKKMEDWLNFNFDTLENEKNYTFNNSRALFLKVHPPTENEATPNTISLDNHTM